MATKYPWPSTVNVGTFVTVRPCLRGKRSHNFSIWEEQMLCLLEGQGVLGFIYDQPPKRDVPLRRSVSLKRKNLENELKVWRRTDRLVKGWILGSIGRDALDAVSKIKETARDVWEELHEIFDQKKDGQSYSRDVSSMYLELYKAAWTGDWDAAQNVFRDNKEEATAIISSEAETTLHVAVMTGKANKFVTKMVELMPANALAMKDNCGETALHNAAIFGNTEAAKALVNKNRDLLYILNDDNEPPILKAAISCQKETLQYLISMSEINMECPFQGKLGTQLLSEVIGSGFFDVALELVDKYPGLAQLKYGGDDDGLCALSTIASMRSAFPSGESFSWWQNFINHSILSKQSKCEAAAETSDVGDIESRSCEAPPHYYLGLFKNIEGVGKKVECIFWQVMEHLVPHVKEMRDKSVKHKQALQLVKKLCAEMVHLPEKRATPMLLDSILRAAENGINEIVEVIMEMYPLVTFVSEEETGNDVFLWAATNRHENVFNIIYSLSDHLRQAYENRDLWGNNLMHICGKLAPPHRLNLVPGAALQMQRELQWFKEVKKFVHPSHRTEKNEDDETPEMVFTREHRQLKEEGEKWMKDTATACNIAAALIATVMFAAAFTVPGGVEQGSPVFLKEFAFDLFAVSDEISLFTSITSLLMFLSILTSRYAEEDFLYVLPKRLTLGLASLFVSITFMLAAFCAAMYLIFRTKRSWILITMAAFAGLPVTSFVMLQFPLLVEVVYSTYGPGLFGNNVTLPATVGGPETATSPSIATGPEPINATSPTATSPSIATGPEPINATSPTRARPKRVIKLPHKFDEYVLG